MDSRQSQKKMLMTCFVFSLFFECVSRQGLDVCTPSGQSSLPCSKLQLVKNIDPQSCEWSASGIKTMFL